MSESRYKFLLSSSQFCCACSCPHVAFWPLSPTRGNRTRHPAPSLRHRCLVSACPLNCSASIDRLRFGEPSTGPCRPSANLVHHTTKRSSVSSPARTGTHLCHVVSACAVRRRPDSPGCLSDTRQQGSLSNRPAGQPFGVVRFLRLPFCGIARLLTRSHRSMCDESLATGWNVSYG